MKKILFLSALAGLFLSACTEGDYGIKPADPQTNEQESAVTFPTGLTAAAVNPIDLAKVEADSVAIAAYTPTQTAVGELSNFRIILDDVVELAVNADMKVPVDELQAIVVSAFGKRPAARTFKAVLEADVMVGGQASYVASDKFDVVITPVAPFISSGYYLIGNMNDWNTDNAKNFAFNHSGKDVYEDPIFTITFTAGADCYWKIIPQSNYDAENPWRDNHAEGVLGTAVDGDSSLEGVLVTSSPQAGKIAEAGMYMMTINMMDYTYKLNALAPEFYLVGDNFAWNVNEKKYLMYAESASVQSYTGEFNGNLKFINGNDMGSDNWGACYGTPVDGDIAASGSLVQNGGAIHSPESGYYTFVADLATMTYTWTKIEEPAVSYGSMAVVGGFQGWNPGNPDTQMIQLTPHNWCLQNVDINTDEFKIAANGAWDESWGELNMTENNYGRLAAGGNCKVVPGVYNVYFNDITKQCTIIKQ